MAEGTPANLSILQHLEGSTDDAITSFKSKAAWYRRRYFVTSMSTLLFSIVTTVLAGWKFSGNNSAAVSNLILVFSALSTLATGWGYFYAPKESWQISQTTLNRMKSLRTKIAFGLLRPNLTDAEISAYSQEYQDILDRQNEAWSRLRFNDAADKP